ncbi:hypothetical protein [Methanobrevibacter millerae]|uniref:Uncharacterized protein n=1 Tax=Methanobrevibacter millerae TaxID=230361 RepID=A0A1G5X4G9_9EURY|nr:hypothetical protein [Methanobrevibacter millerae]SDA65130.1 hypothetical protein SAMN02910315_01944 [Methanobrevibacter millerae]
MTKMNLEIIDYINNADLDDNLKQFFINAIIYELRNQNKTQFTAAYTTMIESAIKSGGDE